MDVKDKIIDSHNIKQPPATWAYIVIGLLAAALLAVVVWFGLDVFNLYKMGAIRPAVSGIRRRPGSRPTLVANQIQGWMTFRYIGYVFHLPANYLAANLKITDPNYPNITLNKYASGHNLNGTTFVQSIRGAVAAYGDGNKP
jgi:hypothetical protein